MKRQAPFVNGLYLYTLTFVTIFLNAAAVIAQPVDEPLIVENSTASETESSVVIDDVIDQIKLIFHLDEATKGLNSEESGINSLSDTAGLSLSEGQLLTLRQKYYEMLKKDPGNDQAWAALGSIYETMGKEDEALAAYQEALQINPENAGALQGKQRLIRSRRLFTRVYYSFQNQQEYAPALQHDLATWEEQTITVQAAKSWGRGKTFGIGWLESSIYQKNELYNDVDFSLQRQAPFMYVSWPLVSNTSFGLRIRDEQFTDNDNSGFYKINDSEHIITGYLSLSWRSGSLWTDFNYSREREPDPVYDLATERSALNIEVKELAGVSAGWGLAKSWELGASLYYEQYGSMRDDQFNPNIQLSHWLSQIPGARMSLGYGYYTEEEESIYNFTASYQWQPLADVQLKCEYQLEYSENEDSLLNQGDVVLSWSVIDRLALVVRGDYSQESGGDEDSNFFAQTSLNWTF